MDIEEKKEKIRWMEKYFLKSFLISFFLLLLSTLLCIVLKDYQIAFSQKYFNIDAIAYGKIAILLLGLWKILIVQFTLIPFLALFALRKCCCCCSRKSSEE